jgi:ABC-2 type transport system ATP-binding protein
VLDIVGLGDVAAQRVGTFSLGMSQRLGIAAALLGDPDTLIFDEPINGLDPDGIVWIRNLMKNLAAEGRTVFLSSHLMSEMAQTADHLLVIAQGRIIADAGTDEFINQNAAPSVRVRAVQQTPMAPCWSPAWTAWRSAALRTPTTSPCMSSRHPERHWSRRSSS